jgi:hypothetical protein
MKYLFSSFLFLFSTVSHATPSNITIDQILELSRLHQNERYYLYCSARGFQPNKRDVEYWTYNFDDFPFPAHIEFQYEVIFDTGGGNGGMDGAVQVANIYKYNDENDYFKVDGFNAVGYMHTGHDFGSAGRFPQEGGILEFISINVGTAGGARGSDSTPLADIDINYNDSYGEVGKLTMTYDVENDSRPGVYAPVSCRITKRDANNTSNTTSEESTSNTENETGSGGGSIPQGSFLLTLLIGIRRWFS